MYNFIIHKLFLVFAIIIFNPFVADCQNQYFQNWAINTDSTNQYVATQHLHLNELAQSLVVLSTQSDSIDIYKTDSSGIRIWRKKYHVAPFDNRVTSTKIASDPDFNYYMTIRGGGGSTQLVKLDSAGNILLNIADTLNNYLYSFPAWNQPISSLIAYDANYVYVTKRFFYNNPYPEVDYLTKYDHQFNPIWTRKLSTAYSNSLFHISLSSNGSIHAMVDTFNTSSDTIYAFRLSFDSNGDTILYHDLWRHKFMFSHQSSTIDGSGRALLTLRYDTATWTSTPPSILIARIDTTGTIMWSDTLWSTATHGEDPAALYSDSTGNAYLLTYQTFNQINTLAKRRIYLRKYDQNGQIIWLRSWEGNDSTSFLFRPPYLKYFDENNIFITGSIVNSGSFHDAFIVKTDTAGNQLWQSYYSANNNLGETFSAIEKDQCNNLYVIGLTDSLIAIGSFLNLVKYNTEIQCYTNSIEPVSDKFNFKVYPNPTLGRFWVETRNDFKKRVIKINDITGRLIQSTETEQGGLTEIKLKNPTGVYCISVEGLGTQTLILSLD